MKAAKPEPPIALTRRRGLGRGLARSRGDEQPARRLPRRRRAPATSRRVARAARARHRLPQPRHLPPVRRPRHGHAACSALVAQTFEDFRYTDELDGRRRHALIFRASVAGKELEGIDLLRFDDQGLIADFTVMLRPLSGLDAVRPGDGREGRAPRGLRDDARP